MVYYMCKSHAKCLSPVVLFLCTQSMCESIHHGAVLAVCPWMGSLCIMDDGLAIILRSPTTASGLRWTAEDTAGPSDQLIQSCSVHSCYAASPADHSTNNS